MHAYTITLDIVNGEKQGKFEQDNSGKFSYVHAYLPLLMSSTSRHKKRVVHNLSDSHSELY